MPSRAQKHSVTYRILARVVDQMICKFVISHVQIAVLVIVLHLLDQHIALGEIIAHLDHGAPIGHLLATTVQIR